MRRWIKRLLTPPLLLMAALFFVAEGALWRLAAFYAWLGRLPLLRRGERWIAGLPPYGALAVFGVPSVAMAPVKFLALYWIAGGHPTLGIGVIAAAKVAGTALVARLYQLTRPQLVTLAWFARCESLVLRCRTAAYEWWQSSSLGRWTTWRWRAARERFRTWRHAAAARGRHWLALRWSAIRRRLRADAAS